MMGDIVKDPEEWLKYYSELLQTTRTLRHADMDTASHECRLLIEHVRELNGSGLIYTKYPFPDNVEYKQKAGQVLVSSGSLAILCDTTVKWLAIIRQTPNAEKLGKNIVFLEDILFCLAHFTDHNAVVCKAVQDHQKLVPALLIQLDEWHGEHLAGTLEENQTNIVSHMLVTLHNVAQAGENVQYLQGLPNVLRILKSYTTAAKGKIRCDALATMAELVREEEVDMLATDNLMVRYIFEQLDQALQSQHAYSAGNWEVTEMIRAIGILAKNEDNKKLLVEEAVLSYLERVLTCTNYERKDCSRCHESTKALLNLSTAEQHKKEIVKNERLLDCVVKIYHDKAKTHSKECFDTAEKVLSSLFGQLQAHQKYKRIAFQILRGQTHEIYAMSARPRGHCLIINNRDFSSDLPETIPLETREGTDVDRDKLRTLFEGMKFKVTCQNNVTDEEMIQQLQAVAHMNHSRYDVFVCCILSHGDAGCVYGSNSVPVEMRHLMSQFQADSCRSLAGKPKLFFIQACQGRDGERGHDMTETDVVVETDVMVEDTRPGAIPNEADFLLGHCTVPGYVSYRHVREGSWYISTLCDVLDIHYENRDILDILTMVNKEVSEKMGDERQQQVPAPMYTLKKKLIFGE